jgi:hypothetical protein
MISVTWNERSRSVKVSLLIDRRFHAHATG